MKKFSLVKKKKKETIYTVGYRSSNKFVRSAYGGKKTNDYHTFGVKHLHHNGTCKDERRIWQVIEETQMKSNKIENMKGKVQVEIAPDHTSCNQLIGWMEVQVERNVCKVYFHAYV